MPEAESLIPDDASPSTEDSATDDFARKAREAIDGRERDRLATENAIARAQRAEADAAAARQAAQNARSAQFETAKAGLTAALDSVKREGDDLERKLAVAWNDGNMEEAAKIQRNLSRVENQRDALETNVRAAEEESKRPRQEQRREPDRRLDMDPKEAAYQQLTPRAYAWVKQHEDTWQDDGQGNWIPTPELMAAHAAAMAMGKKKGFGVDSDGYFSAIEKIMDIGQDQELPDRDGGGEVVDLGEKRDNAREKARQRVAVDAPPSRSVAGERPLSASQVRLSRDELEAAEISGMTPEEYARNKLAIARERR